MRAWIVLFVWWASLTMSDAMPSSTPAGRLVSPMRQDLGEVLRHTGLCDYRARGYWIVLTSDEGESRKVWLFLSRVPEHPDPTDILCEVPWDATIEVRGKEKLVREEPAQGFQDRATCHVQGYVYASADEAPSFSRIDFCREVRTEVREGLLLMTTPRFWAAVVLPPLTRGHTRFWYRWGSGVAHLETTELPVAFGPVGRG